MLVSCNEHLLSLNVILLLLFTLVCCSGLILHLFGLLGLCFHRGGGFGV